MSRGEGWWRCWEFGLAGEADCSRGVLCLVRAEGEIASRAAYQLLNVHERRICDGYRHAVRRESYLAGRRAAKLAVAQLCGVTDPAGIWIGSGAFSQPLVLGSANIQVSISHAGPWAGAMAFSEGTPLGFDLETLGRADEATVRSVCDAGELAWLDAPGQAPRVAPGVLWTAREALGKALKTGLVVSPALLGTVGWEVSGNVVRYGYGHFPQYRGVCLMAPGAVVACCHPAMTELDLDWVSVADWLRG